MKMVEKNTADEPVKDNAHWVQCKGYRCLAYQDKNGKWRTFTGRELTDIVEVDPDLY